MVIRTLTIGSRPSLCATAPEQLQVMSRPPGATRRMAAAFNLTYFCLARSRAFLLGASLGGSAHATTPQLSTLQGSMSLSTLEAAPLSANWNSWM